MVAPRRLTALAIIIASSACAQSNIETSATPPDLDRETFRCNAQPVLVARCAFVACHGDPARPLLLYAEQRLRLGIEWDDYLTPLTDEETDANFRAALGWLARNPGDADLLVDKPLDTSAGGLFHGAKDQFGNTDVFASPSDPGHAILRAFADGETAEPGCAPREDVGP